MKKRFYTTVITVVVSLTIGGLLGLVDNQNHNASTQNSNSIFLAEESSSPSSPVPIIPAVPSYYLTEAYDPTRETPAFTDHAQLTTQPTTIPKEENQTSEIDVVIDNDSQSKPPISYSDPIPQGFYITIYQGRVAVIGEGEQTPQAIYDVSVKMLPEPDQNALAHGIYAKDYQTALTLVEDYIS